TGIGHGTFNEIVLHDVHLRTGRRQSVPQLAKIADFHSLIVGYEYERRAFELLGKIQNNAGFFWSHSISILCLLDYTLKYGAGSTRTPGDMVALIVRPSRYRPFALAGRARTTASITAFPFSTSAFSSNENLPTGTATLPFLSSLNSTRPAFTSPTALAVSSVTVPVRGLGISPRGLPVAPLHDNGCFDFFACWRAVLSPRPLERKQGAPAKY